MWVLGCFVGFAVLFYLIQSLFGGAMETDPRAGERLAASQEVGAAQTDLLKKMGLTDAAKREALFAKAATELKAKKPIKSSALVPGSPTQLQQMAAEAAKASPPASDAKPAAAAPAPAPAPQN